MPALVGELLNGEFSQAFHRRFPRRLSRPEFHFYPFPSIPIHIHFHLSFPSRLGVFIKVLIECLLMGCSESASSCEFLRAPLSSFEFPRVPSGSLEFLIVP